MLQILITVFVMFADVCGIVSVSDLGNSKALVESLVRCISILAFTIFYYVSVSDSFGSESLFFPLYLLFLSVSELRILEAVQVIMNFYLITSQHIVYILIVSSFMLGFSVIGFCLLAGSSNRDTDLFVLISLVASFSIAHFGPKAVTISETWSSKSLLTILILFYLIGCIASISQTIAEASVLQKIRYAAGVPLLINNFINLVYNTNSMNFFGTVLSIVSLGLFILLVKINTARQ